MSPSIVYLGGRVMRKKRGVAIRGMCSAQCASIYCMQHEHFWHQQQAGRGVPWDPDCDFSRRHRVTLSLHSRSYRFKDNMAGVRSGKSSVESVRKYFQRVLGVELQVEGEGREWTNLQACMRLYDGRIHLFVKQKMAWDVPEHKRLLRFFDVSSPNASIVLRSLAPALCQKALFYAFDVQGVLHIIYELQCKQYPTSWWLPHLHRVLHMPPGRLRNLGIDNTIVDSTHTILCALSDPSWGPSIHSMGHA